MHLILQSLVLLFFFKLFVAQHTGDFKEPPPTRWGRQRVTRLDWSYGDDMHKTELREEYDGAQFEILGGKKSHGPRRTFPCFDPSPGLYSDSKEPLRRLITKKSHLDHMIGDFEDLEEPQHNEILGNMYRIQGVKRRPLPTWNPPPENASLDLKIEAVKRRPLPTWNPPPENASLDLKIEAVKRRPLPTWNPPPENASLDLKIEAVKRRPIPTWNPPPENASLDLKIEAVKRRPLPTWNPPPENASLDLKIEAVKRRPLPTWNPPPENASLDLKVENIKKGMDQLFW
ncbi:uncharacterized protein LOC103518005 isoform X1 [Diaphorina citri]|uniref:Uncharacterized protein LOC103518005 isoform X1 n=1 Tax=Diaphorina citri TaxID=121845 RepID=A0A3Q0JAP1_DIACI|nr:uncharacterized protein LOC103518005 isoform X1 [Diaphorina citri]